LHLFRRDTSLELNRLGFARQVICIMDANRTKENNYKIFSKEIYNPSE
jgi:hypothetical protein